ncbi:MAG: lambda exonuclease family protein [Bacteroidota bacterium]
MCLPLGTLTWHEMPQRSPEWFAARAGKVTGSKCSPLATAWNPKKLRSGIGPGAWTLVYKLAGELRTPLADLMADEPYQNYWMRRGEELEPEALERYQDRTWNTVNRIGFVSVEGRLAGCSPDFMVDEHRGGEIKCLKMAHHIHWLDTLEIDPTHYRQIQWCLFLTGFLYWDIVHYNPDAGANALHIHEIKRDEKLIGLYRERLPMIENQIRRVQKLAA